MPSCEIVGLDFVERAGLVIKAHAQVKASPSQIWQVLNDTQGWPEWFDGMKSAEVTSTVWDGVGSTRRVKVGPMRVDEKMVSWEPDRQWAFCVTELNALGYIAKRMLEVVDIEADGSGSKLTYTGALDLVPWLRPAHNIIEKQVGSAWAEAFANIDNHLTARDLRT